MIELADSARLYGESSRFSMSVKKEDGWPNPRCILRCMGCRLSLRLIGYDRMLTKHVWDVWIGACRASCSDRQIGDTRLADSQLGVVSDAGEYQKNEGRIPWKRSLKTKSGLELGAGS